MVLNTILKAVSPFVPVAGSAYGFAKTCIRVYNSTSPSQAVIVGVKGIIINCTPPVIRYPALCATAFLCAGATCLTGDTNFAISTFECCSSIVEG